MARPSPRNNSEVPSWLWAAALLFAAAAALIVFAERRIAPLLSGGLAGEYTTRIYAAPHSIRVGDPLTAQELRERLRRLKYVREAGIPRKPGAYHEEAGLFDARLRGFSHPFIHSTPVRVQIEIRDGSVRSLRMAAADGAAWTPLLEALLEPELVYEISGTKRVRRKVLRDGDIPPRMAQAVIAIEDKRFFEHRGIDLRGLARAAWKDIRSLRLAEGGSTLTQQLARTLFLTPRRTLRRKTAEALCALYLELRLSKKDLLRFYLDSVYFGQNGPIGIVGLPEAARHFFDKEPKDLSLGECALLAGVLRSPYYYNPFRNPDAALRRRNLVLGAMRAQGVIASAEEAAARREPLRVTRSGQEDVRPADYFVAFLQRRLETRYDDEALLTKGLTIYTTLDPWLQELAGRAVRGSKQQAALLALDPRSGAIRALVGGKDFAASPFDRATQARRQPGSAFKPFVYGAALRAPSASGKPWTLSSLLEDATQQYAIEGGNWSPRNYDRKYRGQVTLRAALADSLNAATINLAGSVGPQRVIDYARSLGISSPLRPELGLAIGVFEVTLLELTGAYCAFANGGMRVEPYAVEAALDSSGEVLEFHTPELRRSLSPGEAYLMTSLLRDVVLSGTAQSLKAWGLEGISAGKTGTTNEGKDAWFVGYTPRLAAGVWTGSDQPVALGLSGAGAALPVWADFMRAAFPPAQPPVRSLWRPAAPAKDPWPQPPDVVVLEIDPETGQRARMGCPNKRSEVFLAGTEPEAYCALHAGGVAAWLHGLFHRGKEAPKSPDR